MTVPPVVQAVLVDTDVYSYLMKGGRPADIYRPHVEGKLVAISFVTVGELYFGAYKRKWGPDKIANLTKRLRSTVIVPYDVEVCKRYAAIRAHLEAKGTPVAANDIWIAACAIRHSIPLVSNNRAHFEVVPDLVLISEAPAVKELKAQKEMFEPSN